jgi:GDPmannose 4,6-dehydratase
VRAFVEAVAAELGLNIHWRGEGVNEEGVDQDGRIIVRVDSRYFRPTEVETLLGDPSKAKQKLGWEARTSFHELVAEMVREDLKDAERDALCKREGYKALSRHE